MKKNQYLAIGALAALTALTPKLQAADAKLEVNADIDKPEAEAQAELNRDRDRDLDRERTLTAEQAESERDKVMKHNKASGLLGMEVRNSQNEKLGDVKDLVLDMNTGKVSYAVLAVGGFLGIGEKLLAIPPSALKISSDMTHLTLDADRAKIEAAPGFAATSWPSVNNPDINKFWGASAVGAPAGGQTDRVDGEIKRDRDLDLDVDAKVDKKDKIYTDAEKDRKVRIDVDND